jgi:hypothetical protein
MSGYLQRIAASAARPARAVFPLVGGLFASQPPAGSARDSHLEHVETETQVVRQHEQSPRAMPVAQQPWQANAENRIKPAEPQAFPPREEEHEVPARPATLDPPYFTIPSREPLVAGWRETTAPQRGGPAATGKEETESRRARADRDEAAHMVARQADEGAGIHAVWPTPSVRQAEVTVRETAAAQEIVEHQPADASREADRQPPMPLVRAAPGRVESPRQPVQRDVAGRGVQDIEIHIGRIEVIAVPQQQQRPAPARAQHGESLDAYLKRHDRRSR